MNSKECTLKTLVVKLWKHLFHIFMGKNTLNGKLLQANWLKLLIR